MTAPPVRLSSRPALRWAVALWLALSFAVVMAGLVRAGLISLVAGDLGLNTVGWGGVLALLGGVGTAVGIGSKSLDVSASIIGTVDLTTELELGIGLAAWCLGWGVLAFSFSGLTKLEAAPSEAVGKPLFPRLAQYRDLHLGTLAAYGLGLLFAQLLFILSYTLMVGKQAAGGAIGAPNQGASINPFWFTLVFAAFAAVLVGYLRNALASGPPSARAAWVWRVVTFVAVFAGRYGAHELSGKSTETSAGLAPVEAFLWAIALSGLLAFAGGFLGAANSKRLSTPEATMALLYFGLPIPFVLTVIHQIPSLSLNLGYRLREVIYLSSLLGENRPELGYWLIFAALGISMYLGISLGFVSTSSGRLDLRTNYELFIATRHVTVLRPNLILGVFSVMFFFVIPPLALYAIVSAAEAAVERTRIRRLGQRDPLLAAEALNEVKLKEQTPTSLMTFISVLGVGIGVWAMVIVLSVMSGFEADLQKKILGTNSHGIVMKYTPDMSDYPEVMQKIGTVRNVIGQTPFILNEVMVSSEGNVSGAMIKGIDPKTVGSVTDLPDYMLPGGSLNGLDDPKSINQKHFGADGALDDKPAVKGSGTPDIERDPLIDVQKGEENVLPGIVLGRELAASLKVIVGDRLNVVSPLGGDLGPQGPMPKIRPFRVAGIFYSGMYEYDSKFVYIALREAQTFFNVKGASGIEIKVADVDNARNTMKGIYDKLEGYPYRTKDWGEMNRNLFSALRLEKLVMALILSIIVVVAAGLIVATMFMLVLEKRKEIAVLKALGVPDGGIVKIFLMEGLQIGVVGAVLGLVAGLAHCLFIEKVGIKLDAQVYYIPALPVRIEPFQIAFSVVVAVLITFLASVYPALKAAQVEPVDGLKSE